MPVNIINRKIILLKEVFTPLSFDEQHFEMDWTMEAKGMVPTHLHRHMDEHFTVTKGEVTFQVNGETIVKQAGETLFVPKMVPHGINNKTNGQIALRVRYTPCVDAHKMFEAMAYFADEGNGMFTGMLKWWYVQEKMGWRKFSEPADVAGRLFFAIIGGLALLCGALGGWKNYLKEFEEA